MQTPAGEILFTTDLGNAQSIRLGGAAFFFLLVWVIAAFQLFLVPDRPGDSQVSVPLTFVGLGIGGVLLFLFWRERQRLSGPRLQVLHASAPLQLGKTMHLQWQWQGPVERVHRLALELVGREHSSTGGEDGSENLIFVRIPFANSNAAQSEARLLVPRDTMHSFDSPNNGVLWDLYIWAELIDGPDLEAWVPLKVLPLPSKNATVLPPGSRRIVTPVLEPHPPAAPRPNTAAGLGGYLGDVLT